MMVGWLTAMLTWEQGHCKREAEVELARDAPGKRMKVEMVADAQRLQS